MAQVAWKTLPVSDPIVSAHLAERFGEDRGEISISNKSRFRRQRLYLRLRKDAAGFYVQQRRRKHYIGSCDVTFIDGEPRLFRFIYQERNATT